MTIPDIHHPHMYWSPQRGPTPEQKRVVSAPLTHAGMHLVTGRHFSGELEHGYRRAVPLDVWGQERLHARARDRARDGARAAPFCRFSLISHRNCGKLATRKTPKPHFRATPASDRFDRERAARGIDFDAVGKARLIENMAKIDPHSLRERDSPFFMKRRKVIFLEPNRSPHAPVSHKGRAKILFLRFPALFFLPTSIEASSTRHTRPRSISHTKAFHEPFPRDDGPA